MWVTSARSWKRRSSRLLLAGKHSVDIDVVDHRKAGAGAAVGTLIEIIEMRFTFAPGAMGGNAWAGLLGSIRTRVQFAGSCGAGVCVALAQPPRKWNPSVASTLKRGAPAPQWVPL